MNGDGLDGPSAILNLALHSAVVVGGVNVRRAVLHVRGRNLNRHGNTLRHGEWDFVGGEKGNGKGVKVGVKFSAAFGFFVFLGGFWFSFFLGKKVRKKKKGGKGKVKIDVQNKRMRRNVTNGCVNFSYDIHSKVDRVLRSKGSKKLFL